MKTFWMLFFLVLLIFGGFWGYQMMTGKPQIEVIETSEVTFGDVRAIIVETGIIKPQVGAQVKIGTRATGEIFEMRVKIGDRVKKGELIALIDDREIVKAIDQTIASIQSAKYRLRQVQLTFPERIIEAHANHEYAKIDYQREKQLIKNEYTTQDAVDLAKSRFEATLANLKRLKDEYHTQLEIAKADLEALEAQLKRQQISLSYTQIYAPMDGVVSEVTAQAGETIVSGLQVSNLVTVLDPNRLEMWIYVDETDVGKVKIGQPVEYSVDTYPNTIFKGDIRKLYPQPVLRENITYYLAIVPVSKTDAAMLKPEMTTYVRIILNEKNDVLVAPNASIKFEKGQQVGYKVISSEQVDKVPLQIGIRGEEKTEILSGVKAGDILATKLILPVTGKTK